MRKRTYNTPSGNYKVRLDAKYKSNRSWMDESSSVMYYARPRNQKYNDLINKYKKVKRGL